MQYNKRDAVAVYSNNEEGTCDELVVDFYNRRFEYTSHLEERELSGKTIGGIKIFKVPQAFFRQLSNVVAAQFNGSYYVEEKTYPQRLAEKNGRRPRKKRSPSSDRRQLKRRSVASFLKRNWRTFYLMIIATKRAITVIFPFFTIKYTP